jgi:hypothetical protein
MAFPAVTYSFTNGTASDAGQVNTNFSDLISGFSDGTKDLNMSAGTFSGTVTMNGNVLLGNASGDDIQFNGSLATSIPIKVTRTYDIGSADLGLRIIYLGMNSTFTIALAAPSSGASADYALTLPPVVGGVGDMLYNTGSGTLLWKPSGIVVDAASGASGVTLSTTDEDVQVFSPTAAITVKLDNSFGAGRLLRIFNAGTGADDIITLTANDNATIRQIYPLTMAEVICNTTTPTTNTSWTGINKVTSGWLTFTMSITGASSNPSKASSPDIDQAAYMRDGKDMLIRYNYRHTSATGSAAGSGAYQFVIPDSKLIDTTGFTVNDSSATGQTVGAVSGFRTTVNAVEGHVFAGANSHLRLCLGNNDFTPTTIGSGYYDINSATWQVSFNARMPIASWADFSG